MSLRVTSSAFEDGEVIPVRHTGDGEDVSPPLSFDGVPAGAMSLALICDDPDAPASEPWVHWIVYGLAPGRDGLAEGASTQDTDLRQGMNSWGRAAYGGPAPPRGHGVHHYHFRLYALNTELAFDAAPSRSELDAAMSGHVMAEGELVGTYER